jgi:MATE family multidrug resistance protein
LAFGTDGIHWGTADFRYLRNGVLVSTALGSIVLVWVDESGPEALTQIWWVTAVWITSRAAFGIFRIWPGLGAAPLGRRMKR